MRSLCPSLVKYMCSPLAEHARIVTCVAQLRRLSASQSTQANLAEALV